MGQAGKKMQSGAGEPERTHGRLLVVDDNEMNRDMLSRRLERKGYSVAVAADGGKALEMMAAEEFDLVLLDIMMPGISGLQVLKEVRRNHTLADLPVIMATARTESVDIVDALKLGANDYVTKPLDFPVVLARVASQLGLKLANEKIRALAEEVELRNQFIRKVFGRYLSDDIVAGLLGSPEGLSLGGAKRDVTILMCDIRGFSLLSARLEPDQVLSMLNNFLSVMTDVILEFGGTIDEFIGDAILVLFGAPVERADHAEAAVACAIRMQGAVEEVNERNRLLGLPPVEMGVGINTGEVVVGNIGSEKRAKYGVVGTNVNLAARIEGYTTGGQVLISDNTYKAVADRIEIAGSKEVHPKGASAPIQVHEVAGLGGKYSLQIKPAEPKMLKLPEPVPAGFTIVDGKDTGGDEHATQITWISTTHGQICLQGQDVVPLAELRIQLRLPAGGGHTSELFAKVISVGDGEALLRFTSVSPSAQTAIASLLA